MEDHRSTRRLNRAELIEASTPTSPKRQRLPVVREEPFELRSEEREAELPLPLLFPYSDSSEKISSPSESREIVSSNCSSNSGPLELPRPSAGSDEDSVDSVKAKFDVIFDLQQQVQSQAKSFETEASACNRDFSIETMPPSQATIESATMKPSPASKRRRTDEAEIPSPEELESFFSAAEKGEQQRFAEKYNYDVVKDVPLGGRYTWIRLKP